MGEFTHFDTQGNAIMVNVSQKQDTEREAAASGMIWMSRECYEPVSYTHLPHFILSCCV